jgi:phosphoenolpyruvate carboxylase
MSKLNLKRLSTKDKKTLFDATLVTISGISASMKNTG